MFCFVEFAAGGLTRNNQRRRFRNRTLCFSALGFDYLLRFASRKIGKRTCENDLFAFEFALGFNLVGERRHAAIEKFVYFRNVALVGKIIGNVFRHDYPHVRNFTQFFLFGVREIFYVSENPRKILSRLFADALDAERKNEVRKRNSFTLLYSRNKIFGFSFLETLEVDEFFGGEFV